MHKNEGHRNVVENFAQQEGGQPHLPLPNSTPRFLSTTPTRMMLSTDLELDAMEIPNRYMNGFIEGEIVETLFVMKPMGEQQPMWHRSESRMLACVFMCTLAYLV